jgi:hypothetical protein
MAKILKNSGRLKVVPKMDKTFGNVISYQPKSRKE